MSFSAFSEQEKWFVVKGYVVRNTSPTSETRC